VLDAAPEVTRLSRTDRFALWRLATPGGRLMLIDGNLITPLVAGRIDAQVQIPPGAAGRTLLLAEPADDGWRAALNGTALRAKQADGWAQAWDVPPSGGQFTLSRGMLTRHVWLGVQLAAVLVVIALALPGGRAEDSRAEPWPSRSRRRGRTPDTPDATEDLAPEIAAAAAPSAEPPAERPIDPPAKAVPEAEPRRRGRGTRRRAGRRIRLTRRFRRSATDPPADPGGADPQREVAALRGPEAGEQ
jgi:hypothetical protein